MFQSIRVVLISIIVSTMALADVFMTELTDPQNSSDAGRYVELYNNGDSDVDLSTGWALQRWTNGNADPQTPVSLTGSIAAGGFYVICTDDAKHLATYGSDCDQDIGTGGPADSNGDDNMALLDETGSIVDMFGVPGEDGSGTGHEFEDGRAERAASVTAASASWIAEDWNIDNDSGGGDGNQYAPEGFDPGAWIGAAPAGDVAGCMDSNANNFNAAATVQDYDDNGTSSCTYDSCADIPTATGCLWDTGQTAEWWEGWWNCTDNGGEVCGLVEIVFELDLPDDISGTPHVNGSYNGWCGSCYNAMSDDDGDGIWTHTQYFSSGETHDYKFTIDGWNNQEDLAGLDCAVVTDGYSNRQFTAGDANTTQTLSACWGSCDDVCAGTPTCGDGECGDNEDCSNCAADCGDCPTYSVTFDVDGVGDCGFVSVTGSFDGWSGWGANTDTNMTASGLADGDYEYTILCVDTSVNEWWNDIWGASTQYSAPSECDFIPGDEYSNYGFTVSGSDTTVSICAGSCDATCPVTYDVTFNVNMSYAGGVDAENGVRIFGLSSWSSSDATTMTCDENDQCSATVSLLAGDYQFKYRNGWSYEDVEGLSCASESGGYWNRDLSVSGDTVLDTACFGACSDCVPGCMDSNASNYSDSANTDDGSCEYAAVDPDNIFFSEYGEGSSYNKYLEIYNATDASVDLSGYQRVNCSNGCDDWEYYTDFADGASIAAGDVYVICDTGVGDDFPSAECDESAALYFNGDDAQGIWHVASSSAIDVIGAIGDDPGSGWEVAGVNNGTKDHSLVRDASVTSGNALWFDNDTETGSAGTEWVVLDQNTWAFIGSHPHDFASTCDDDTACNYGDTADCTFPQEGFDCDGNVLVDVTFNVDMSNETVDTEGWGLSLVLNGYHAMSDDDGDGVWSATLTLVAETLYSYKYKNGDAWENNFNDLGCGNGDTYGDRFFTTTGEDQSLDTVCFNSCSACAPPAPTYSVTFNVDGVSDCGFVSVTGSFDGWSGWGAHTDNSMTVSGLTAGDYEYTILCVDTSIGNWWDDIWGSSTQYSAPAECDFVPGDEYPNYGFTVTDSDMTVSICAGSCGETCVYCSYDGNVNGDDVVNVSDVVMIVGWIIGNGTADACTGDVNQDGVVNVSDVVMIVGWIIGGRADIDDATNANIVLSNNNISIEANGQVSGLQMTLSHGNDFSIDLADAFISEYSTNGNITKLVVVSANSSINHVASCKGSFNVDSAIVVNSNQEIADVNILNLEPVELTLAGPNPFNPTTSLNVVVANDGYVSVNVYNITGQHIATLLNGYMDANTSGYMVNWNASNLSSGVYLVRAETAGSVSTQKLMLLK